MVPGRLHRPSEWSANRSARVPWFARTVRLWAFCTSGSASLPKKPNILLVPLERVPTHDGSATDLFSLDNRRIPHRDVLSPGEEFENLLRRTVEKDSFFHD